MINFDIRKQDIVIVEGDYILLEKEPWKILQEKVFDKTFYVDAQL